jgi:peptidyl-dipeptidase Dcp
MKHSMAFALAGMALMAGPPSRATDFGPSNPFYQASALPFHAPPFDKIKDEDYQPAIEAGMAEQLREMTKIAANPAAPTFENTLVAMERSGRLLARASAAFGGVTQANIDPTLQAERTALAPKLAAHSDAIRLNKQLFERVSAIYRKRASRKLDPESLRLLEVTYDVFVHSGANLSETDKAKLKQLNQESSSLSDSFSKKLLDATQAAAFTTTDKSALAGSSDAQLAAYAQAAKGRHVDGYVIPLQNTLSSRHWCR